MLLSDFKVISLLIHYLYFLHSRSLAYRSVIEKHKRGFQKPKEAVNEAANPSYLGLVLPYLANEVLSIATTTQL
jgi:hypothetical protein